MDDKCNAVLIFLWFCLASLISEVCSHGRLVMPPSRSSMWRYGFPTKHNYNDHELFCGGFAVQWWVNGGKCGVCGDPYNSLIRENEPPRGRYAKGIIVATYRRGETITIKVEISASHKGYFEFRLCPHNNINVPVTQECLDRYLLQDVGGETKIYVNDNSGGFYEPKLRLPGDVICDQCVLQWRYHTGNRWGCDENNKCGMGKGPQEEFRACADIAIISDGEVITTKQPNTTISETTTVTSTPAVTTTAKQVTSRSTAPSTTRPTTPTGPTVRVVCSSAGAWKGLSWMDNWCVINCARNYCPASHCKCGPEGQLVYDADGLLGTGRDCLSKSGEGALNDWCRHNCPLGFCDPNICYCVQIRTP